MSPRQLKLVRKWLDDDWESHDHDRELVRLVGRLLDSCERIGKPRPKPPATSAPFGPVKLPS